MKPARRSSRGGFTLAEVAVTIVIVGIALVLVLQGLNTSKAIAAQTRYQKLSRSLALVTLGQVESGLFQEDIENGLVGTYSEDGYPEIAYEVVVGDATFREANENGQYDSWAPRDDEEKAEEDEEIEEPFEKVKIRITFPKVAQMTNEILLERWMPWKQVHGEGEEGDANKDGGGSAGDLGKQP